MTRSTVSGHRIGTPKPRLRRRRPLGASLAVDERASVLERRLRELQEAANDLAWAWHALDTIAADPRKGRRQVDRALMDVRIASSRVEAIARRNVGRARRSPPPPPETVPPA